MTITTETGRTLTISLETARTIEAAGVSPAQVDLDIDGLIAGKSTDALLLFCLEGSDGQESEWNEYVAACRDAAEAEARLYAAARLHVADVLSMGALTAADIAAQPDDVATEDWDASDLGLDLDSIEDRRTLANAIREAARQVQS